MNIYKHLIILIIFSLITLSCNNSNTKIRTELYIGLTDKNGNNIEDQWLRFKNDKLNNIIDGYTEIKGNGFWKNSKGVKFHEKTSILIYIHKKSVSENVKIDSIIELIKNDLHQESVLKIQFPIASEFK